jgi:hypothetical protein
MRTDCQIPAGYVSSSKPPKTRYSRPWSRTSASKGLKSLGELLCKSRYQLVRRWFGTWTLFKQEVVFWGRTDSCQEGQIARGRQSSVPRQATKDSPTL